MLVRYGKFYNGCQLHGDNYRSKHTHALTFDMNFDFRTAGLPKIWIDDTVPCIGAIDTADAQMMKEAGLDPSSISNYLFGRKNNGLGIDLGFNYHVNDKLL